MTKLTADAVHALVKRALFEPAELQDGKTPADAVIVEGIMHTFGFHPQRIAAEKPEIDALLAELPDGFHAKKGGGWSFLNGCEDRNGNQWGEHRDLEALLCLGIAVGSAMLLMSRDVWEVLPGGMPYFRVNPEVPHG